MGASTCIRGDWTARAVQDAISRITVNPGPFLKTTKCRLSTTRRAEARQSASIPSAISRPSLACLSKPFRDGASAGTDPAGRNSAARSGTPSTHSTHGCRRSRAGAAPMVENLPVNLDAERFVLGSILLDDITFPEGAGVDLFSLERHRRIFRRMCDLRARGERIDRVTIVNELQNRGEF